MPLHEGEAPPPMERDESTSRKKRVKKFEYRGIFSSSICDLFNSPRSSRTDACALACCGVWLWERNQYLLKGRYPKSWRQRPVEVVIVVLLIAASVIWTLDPTSLYLQICFLAVMVLGLWRLMEFEYTRSGFRHELAVEEYKRQSLEDNLSSREPRSSSAAQSSEFQDPLANREQQKLSAVRDSNFDTQLSEEKNRGLEMFLNRNWREIHGPHDFCNCVRTDTAPTGEYIYADDEENKKDLCQKLWHCLANTCCKTCCMCWCLCCGMCAIAQEHRHLVQVLPESTDLWQRDYVTMELWSEYFPKILELRNSANMSFFKHCRALSQLSKRLLQAIGLFLLFATSLAFLPVKFDKWQIAVLFGTLLEPIIIMFFVYWYWNRLDISFDAIVKYFGSGFFLCTSMVLVYEMIASAFCSLAVILYSFIGTSFLVAFGEVDLDKVNALDEEDFGIDMDMLDTDTSTSNSTSTTAIDLEWTNTLGIPIPFVISIAVLGAFCNAFFVASLIEELFKYLSFWMVEHPDLENDVKLEHASQEPHESNSSTEQRHAREDMELLPDTATQAPPNYDDEGTNKLEMETQTMAMAKSKSHPTSLVSRASAITIAMVAVATGFSCAENFLYVFVYTEDNTIQAEATTLIMRAIFPVHPICAALQSIGVIRRDLENDARITGVGRIILVAWLLHGSFDFVLMAYVAVNQILHPSTVEEEDQVATTQDLIVMGCTILLPILGLEYFFYHSHLQKKRLANLDSGRVSTNTGPIV